MQTENILVGKHAHFASVKAINHDKDGFYRNELLGNRNDIFKIDKAETYCYHVNQLYILIGIGVPKKKTAGKLFVETIY